jgi:hypothetical protein
MIKDDQSCRPFSIVINISLDAYGKRDACVDVVPDPTTSGHCTEPSTEKREGTRLVAVGRMTPGLSLTSPTFGGIGISGVSDGEVRISFDTYTKPDDRHNYVVHALASFSAGKTEPSLCVGEFDDFGFSIHVVRSGKGLRRADIEKMEFHVTVFVIEKESS